MLDVFQILQQITTDRINAWAKEIVEELKRLHIDAGQVASGETLKQFGFRVEQGSGEIKLYIEGAEHVEYLDRGRGTGKQTPTDDLIDWIKAKGLKSKWNLSTQSKLKSAAFAIARKHSIEGSYQHRTGKTYKGASKPISNAFQDEKINRLNQSLTTALIPRIQSTIIEQFKKAS